MRFLMVDLLKVVQDSEIQDGVQDGHQNTYGQLTQELIVRET